MVEIECLVCGESLNMPQVVNTNKFDGQLVCQKCESLLHVKLVKEKLEKYDIVEKTSKPVTTKFVPAHEAEQGLPEEQRKAERTLQAHDVADTIKYSPLREYLLGYKAKELRLAFQQIEGIIGSELPATAYHTRQWWENSRDHAQAIAWLEADWRVADVNFQQETVILRNESRNA